ncbi:class I SAM-dependent methyltransferase [Kineococcus endophyticus]|uniref:Class I SAM-dependent methyltransferase n=1 Tax=Kineococcus endophyticus TaxID=1181883 RepID=A0ABV3P3J6_9ACTN
MSRGHSHDHSHDHEAQHGDVDEGAAHRRTLDLDAEVFGAQLGAVVDLLPSTVPPRRVVDLGAGTGTGSRLLRERFPVATVTAVDSDPRMLHVLADQGFAVVAADLDEGFPAQLQGADLVWAASSLHHVGDVPQLLADVRAALAPGGVLVVVELEDLPRFTADPVEDRARAAARAAGWNHHPDWTPHLRQAGFAVERHDLVLDVPPSAAAEEFARAWLPRYLAVPGFDEAPALQALLDGDLRLEPRAQRAVWVAR